MTRIMVSALFLMLCGCKQLDAIIQPRVPTPEERAQNMYNAWLGLQLMQLGQQAGPPPAQIFVIDGRQIVCTQMNNVTTCN